ncbi:urea ABC transporter permease subunit UrtB [Bauldia litoralis]|uniref:Amino acid/amide ABC transporter membrane protein 1, HAAT family n=1 Tax=Bauldia litoralis TaxID=665467 RepID=A0A1G6CP62_9HYPH|nr:urea ABC transporter permease subunit UrtB [Bauldia litoralis]SDB34683.1 amino acid/amide ABC transporter membrane protein 1, HAAT family [Bauldia litoralis]
MRILIQVVLATVLALAAISGAKAQDADLRDLINGLAVGGYSETEEQIAALAATGDPAVVPVLEALAEGDVYARKSDRMVFIAEKVGSTYTLTDPLTGETVDEVASGAIDKIKVNNRLRRAIRTALGALTLMSPDAGTRRAAAEAIFQSGDPDAIELIDAAIEQEQNPSIAKLMREARAAAVLNSDLSDEEKVAAIEVIKTRSGRDSLSLLIPLTEVEGPVGAAATAAVSAIEGELAMWDAAQNVWYGLSLGSVLLLAAIGLAITFGVMGVINMAHGEMVMIGAYTTFVVQEIIRSNAPWLFDSSLFIAIPLAFLVAGAVGVAIERGVIRFLYGRPLETLLATWGISLILQQAVRTIFGPTNQQVGTPSWMSGSFEIGLLQITYNRLAIIVFALIVFFLLMAFLKRTPFGLQMRAVTQNRQMASAMGIRTPWVDAMTFGLGSGIAGMAGVALSQIDNVSPNLGQSYIIDSFMVVVFGGVGNLWGTLVGAFTLGIANKFLEPYAGAVLGKILVLVFIILFIQKRPRGLFALRGRAIEA